MGFTAFVGRALFALVFLASSLNKLQSLAEGGREIHDMVSPRLDDARAALSAKTGFDPFALVGNAQLLALATAMELAGAALFAADFALGAKLLMLFVMVVTPVMHPFWAHEDPSSAEAVSYTHLTLPTILLV